MECTYAVTFEFETRPPICIRGKMEATAVNTIASRAVREARKQAKPINWRSVVVLLERIGDGEEVQTLLEGNEGEE